MNFSKAISFLFSLAANYILFPESSERIFAQSDSTTNPAINKVLSIVKTVEDNNNFLDHLNPDSSITLPLGIIKQIGAARYLVAVDSCKFKPDGAYFNAYAAIDFPGTDKKLAFKAENIKFNPEGVIGGTQSRLMLVSEHSIKINNIVTMKLKNDGNNWIEWDCGGFKAINIKGHFIFNKGKLFPDSTQTNDSVVTASFQIYTSDIHNFITQVKITPFIIAGLKNWSFKVDYATVDMSELVNASGMIFPSGYINPNMITPQMWSGFYLQSVKIKLPTEISRAGSRTEVTASNLLIDNMGITGLFTVNNLLALNEGSMSGWDYSIDELGIGFACNQLNNGHIKGKINIPIMDSAQTITYNAAVSYNPLSSEADYAFTVFPSNSIKFSIFSAEVNLNNTSQITVTKSNGLFKPKAILNGYMSFNHSRFNSNGGQLQFQDLTIITQSPYLTQGIFTLHTIGNQTKAANYPASINNISLGINLGAPVMSFSVAINILDNANTGFSAGTVVSLKGKIDEKPVNYTNEINVSYTKTKWKFDHLTVNGISLDIQTSPFTLKGTVLFRENDLVYGDGFFGQLLFSVKKVLPTPSSITACFGAKDTYRYFYVDAIIPNNIPLGSIPVTLTKLAGGMYYHMKPQNASQAELIAASQNQSATTTSALSYIPDPSCALGLKAGVGYKYTPSSKTANGDVMLEIGFTSSGGLNLVKLTGDIYIMAEPMERAKAPVKGAILIQLDAENQIFDASASITVNAYNAVTGNGSAKIHIEPGSWYVCVGKPSLPNKINILNLIDAQAYFIVGNSIEPALAPPPPIAAILGPSGLATNRDQTQLQSGAGFCAGASLSSSLYKEFGFDFFSVYGGYNFGLGFDMMMLNYGSNAHCSGSNDKVGLNGWLASGAMYVYMQGSVGVKGNIHFLPGCNCNNIWCICENFDFKVFEAGVAAMIGGKLPKPLYFSGQFGCNYNICGVVKGNFNFSYEYGKNCNPVSN